MNQQLRIYFISTIAALAGLLFGFDTGVISGAILFIKSEFKLSPIKIEIIISSVLFGAVLGSILSGKLSDKIGRKKLILITACIFCCGTIVCGMANNVMLLIIGRIILGAAIGVASYAAPLYLAELAPKNKRGMLVSLNQLAITLGILLSYIVDYYFSFSQSWRMMMLFGLFPALLLLLGTSFLPESPRFLIAKNRSEEAKDILKKLRSEQELSIELNELNSFKTNKSNWQHLLSNKKYLGILSMGILLATMQQVTGINTIIYYAPTIFQMAGFKSSSAIFVTTLVGITNVLFTIIALPLIDRVGRLKLLYTGLSGMICSLMVLGFCFQQPHLSELLKYLTLISMIIYIACFAVSLGPVMFVLISEIFPLNIRSAGMSLSMGANWTANLLVAISFLSLIEQIGASNTFYLYASISIISLFFIFFFVPETKGYSLEQIETKLLNRTSLKELKNNYEG